MRRIDFLRMAMLSSAGIPEPGIDIPSIRGLGNSWIDTGTLNTGDYIFKMGFKLDSIVTPNGDGNWLIGGRINTKHALGVFIGHSGVFNAYGTSATSGRPLLEAGVWYDMEYSRDVFTISGRNYTVYSGPTIPDAYKANILVGKNHITYSGTGDDIRNIFGEIDYYQQIERATGEVVIDGKPKEVDGIPGLWDKVERRLYSSVGPNEFIVGNGR